MPHEQLAKVSRYVGSDGRAPALSKLGGKAWHTLKARARNAVRELAGELLALYARRQATRAADPPMTTSGWRGWRKRFPYEETDDQQRAIDAVIEDMESRAADGPAGLRRRRLRQDRGGGACGDQSASSGGRQVLVLVPTTMLAQQHGATFRDRFRDFPVEVETVSRFRPPAEVKKVLARVPARARWTC